MQQKSVAGSCSMNCLCWPDPARASRALSLWRLACNSCSLGLTHSLPGSMFDCFSACACCGAVVAVGVIGEICSAATVAAAGVAATKEIPLISPASSSPQLTNMPFFSRTVPSDRCVCWLHWQAKPCNARDAPSQHAPSLHVQQWTRVREWQL